MSTRTPPSLSIDLHGMPSKTTRAEQAIYTVLLETLQREDRAEEISDQYNQSLLLDLKKRQKTLQLQKGGLGSAKVKERGSIIKREQGSLPSKHSFCNNKQKRNALIDRCVY